MHLDTSVNNKNTILLEGSKYKIKDDLYYKFQLTQLVKSLTVE